MRSWKRGGRARGEKGGLETTLTAEVSAEAERLIGEGALDDFQAIETEARRVALQLMGQAVARKLNADHCDERGPHLPCECGAEARLAGRRPQDLHYRSRPPDVGACLVSLRALSPRPSARVTVRWAWSTPSCRRRRYA